MSGDFTFLKGNIETIIMCALYNKDMYGYELAKDIKERTANKYEIKQPTLYSYLKRLEQDGYVYAYWGGESSGGRRRYYKLTEKGRADCEKFLAEWEYQRNVMGSLVDGTADVQSITQDDATALFGRKATTRKRKIKTIDEQDEIARRLSELAPPADDTPVDEPIVDIVTPEPIVEQPVAQVEPTIDEPVVETVSPQVVQQTANFDVNQDDADVFIEDFDKLALQVSQKQNSVQGDAPAGENYQHTLLNIIGDQLDEVKQGTATVAVTNQTFDASAELEEVADNLAREGIRLRIYNHATANFKSKTLMPFSRVLCQTSWITYLFATVLLGILSLTSIGVGNWAPALITLGILLILPVAASIYAVTNQTRIEKPKFNFKNTLIALSILAAIVILTSIAIGTFGNIEFSDYVAVGNKILLPTFISLIPIAGVFVYDYLYKKY